MDSGQYGGGRDDYVRPSRPDLQAEFLHTSIESKHVDRNRAIRVEQLSGCHVWIDGSGNSVRLSTERENEFGDSRPSSEGAPFEPIPGDGIRATLATLSSKLGTALPPIRPLACSVSSLQFE